MVAKVIYFSQKSVNIDNNVIVSENKNELLDTVLDPKLSLEDHISSLCKKVKNSMY